MMRVARERTGVLVREEDREGLLEAMGAIERMGRPDVEPFDPDRISWNERFSAAWKRYEGLVEEAADRAGLPAVADGEKTYLVRFDSWEFLREVRG